MDTTKLPPGELESYTARAGRGLSDHLQQLLKCTDRNTGPETGDFAKFMESTTKMCFLPAPVLHPSCIAE